MTRPRRSGKTLIEMLFVISLMGLVMTISAKTLVVVLNKGRSGRDSMLANSDRSRFSSDFRHDVNAARTAELTGNQDQNGRQIDLKLPNGRVIEYRLQDDELTRLEKQGEQLLRRERYHLGFADAQFGIASGHPEVVSLSATISHHPENSAVPPRQLKFDAVTGKDLRFQTEGTP